MIWHSWQDFFAMGGYGLYVWGSVSVVFTALMVELTELSWRRKAIHAELRLARAVRQKSDKGGTP